MSFPLSRPENQCAGAAAAASEFGVKSGTPRSPKRFGVSLAQCAKNPAVYSVFGHESSREFRESGRTRRNWTLNADSGICTAPQAPPRSTTATPLRFLQPCNGAVFRTGLVKRRLERRRFVDPALTSRGGARLKCWKCEPDNTLRLCAPAWDQCLCDDRAVEKCRLAGGHLRNLWHTRSPERADVSPCRVSATQNSASRSHCSPCRHDRYVEADRADDIGTRRIGAVEVAIRRAEFTLRFRPVRPDPSAWHEMPGPSVSEPCRPVRAALSKSLPYSGWLACADPFRA